MNENNRIFLASSYFSTSDLILIYFLEDSRYKVQSLSRMGSRSLSDDEKLFEKIPTLLSVPERGTSISLEARKGRDKRRKKGKKEKRKEKRRKKEERKKNKARDTLET